jgi:hypothetical protein
MGRQLYPIQPSVLSVKTPVQCQWDYWVDQKLNPKHKAREFVWKRKQRTIEALGAGAIFDNWCWPFLLLCGSSSLEYETRKGKGKDSARDTRHALLAAECEPFNIQYAHEPRAVQYAICKLAPQQVNSAITRQYNSTIQSHACRATRTTTTLVDIILDPLSIHLSIDFQFASRSYIRFRFRLEFDLFLFIDL